MVHLPVYQTNGHMLCHDAIMLNYYVVVCNIYINSQRYINENDQKYEYIPTQMPYMRQTFDNTNFSF